MSAQVGQQPPMTAVQKLSAVNEQTWLSMGKSHVIFSIRSQQDFTHFGKFPQVHWRNS